MKKILCLFSVILLSLNNIIFAQDSINSKFTGWKKAETTHFTFVYEAAMRYMAEKYASFADEAWDKIAEIYSRPQNKTTVYITGRTNTVNAYTYSAPPEIMMFETPVCKPDFGFREDWSKLFFTHELIHIANFTFEDMKTLPYRLFGEAIRSYDLTSIPNWALEGLTTVLETELTDGGRGRSPYFELYFKAPTLDNAFISFSDIGKEEEPPYGQIYVMGYIIFRSIADRWGIQALADIQRNLILHNLSFDEATKFITGYYPYEIYTDARIALAKRYNEERKIPEGKIISPRTVSSDYFKPAVIFNDGSFITLKNDKKKTSSVVYYNPSKYPGSVHLDTIKEYDVNNSTVNETVLFTGSFADTLSVTADLNGTVYASMAIKQENKMPGKQIKYTVYKWTKETKLQKLTKNGSYIEPSVSADGKTLVALEQKGFQYRLVQIDTQTGDVKPILESPDESYIQPCVNKDGSKVAFLVITGKRAKVAFYDLKSDNKKYVVAANGEGDISDPSYPSWNSDGSLVFSNNVRGRLELYEASLQNNRYVSLPKLSDPIGVLWGRTTDRGILYGSFASTGFVIKIKPLSEWGKPASFEGPSKPGQIMKFGDLQEDFKAFEPYTITKNSSKNNAKEYTKRTVRLEFLQEPQTSLSKETLYFPIPQPLIYFPLFGATDVPGSKDAFGFGYAVFGQFPKIQESMGFFLYDFLYYPKINNLSFNFDNIIPIGIYSLDFWIDRTLNVNDTAVGKLFTETTIAKTGFTIPVIKNQDSFSFNDLSILTSAEFHFIRTDENAIAMNSSLPFTNQVFLQAGLEYAGSSHAFEYYFHNYDFTALAVGFSDYNKFYAGFEGEANYKFGNNTWNVLAGIRTRYTDFPYDTQLPTSRANLLNNVLDCSYPGRLIPVIELNFPRLFAILDLKFFTEKLFSYGTNTVNYSTPDNKTFWNFTMDPNFLFGFGLNFVNGRQTFGFGYRWLYNPELNDASDGEFYFDAKLNWYRH
ncbi:MAG: hypothetical protein IKX23_06385 [Treponema sp.]|nr:hypothetical protein [Treponema sp.]